MYIYIYIDIDIHTYIYIYMCVCVLFVYMHLWSINLCSISFIKECWITIYIGGKRKMIT